MPVTGLRETQAWFFARLAARSPRGAAALVEGRGGLSASRRLGIYVEMYEERLVSALAENFPKLHEALGDAPFRRLARQYLAAHPSRHPSLRDLGGRLPRFLRERSRAPRRPWLADLAALEAATLDAFDAADADPLEAGDLGKIGPAAWGTLRFSLTPSLRVLQLGWRVEALWDEGEGTPRREPHAVRVWRRGFEVLRAEVEPLEVRALRRLARGGTLAEICVLYGDAASAARALATWLAEGLLVRSA